MRLLSGLVLGAGLVLAGWMGDLARAQDSKQPASKDDSAVIDGKPIKQWITLIDNKTDRKDLYNAVAALAKAGPKASDAVQALQKLQKEGDPYNQSLAAYALAYIKPEADAKTPPKDLLAILQNKEKSQAVRSVAAGQLAQQGPEAAAVAYEPLVTMLKTDTDSYNRALAAYVLPYLKPNVSDSAVPLVEALKDKNKDVAKTAATSLAITLGDKAKSAAPAVIVVLQTDKDAYHRALAAYVLGMIKADPKQAVAPLTKIVQDKKENENVKKAALDALTKIDPAAAKKAQQS